MWFGLLFFPIALLPVSFTPTRLGYVLYLPLAGLALYVAAFLVGIKDKLMAGVPRFATIALFLATAAVAGTINVKHWPIAPDGQESSYRITHDQFVKLYPHMEPGARILFIHTPFDDNYDMVFLLRLLYRDDHLFITQLNGPKEQRIPLDRLGHYDHIFNYEHNQFVELDNSDTLRSIQFHVLKTTAASAAFGEAMTIGKPGADQYFVKDVLVGDPKADGYWTLDEPELKFQLASPAHHIFTAHFFLPEETMKQTGPLIVDFYVNGKFLNRARYFHAGELFYEHDVPESWLKTDSLTLVRSTWSIPTSRRWIRRSWASCCDRPRSIRSPALSSSEDCAEHRFGQLPRGRVLLAGMIGRDEPRLTRSGAVFPIVPEHERRPPLDLPLVAQNAEIHIERHAPQRQHHLNVRQQLQFALQVRPARADLFRRRLVVRRSASHGRADVGVRQRQAVVARDAGRLRRKPRRVERLIKEVARAVAGEHPPGSIRAVRPRRQTNQQQPRTRIAEPRHRLRPVIPIAISPPLHASHFGAILHQPRTLRARDNFPIQNVEGFQAKA